MRVRGNRHVGGLLGYEDQGIVTDCHSSSSVIGQSQVGGLVGDDFGTVTRCCSSGTVNGAGSVGGLIGSNAGAITQCTACGAVTGETYVGGLVGYCGHTVTQCYSTGTVSGSSYVGGLVGRAGSDRGSAHISESYSTGSVAGDVSVGGLLGEDQGNSVASCFWDMQTSGQAGSDRGIGKTTAEMQAAGTFLQAGWDFLDETANGTDEIWWILEGRDYPRLWWELLGDDAVVSVIDDFEDYNDVEGHEIWAAWLDPYDTLPNGGIAGHFDPPYAEQTIVHSGLQSMPFYYRNTEGIVNSRAYRLYIDDIRLAKRAE